MSRADPLPPDDDPTMVLRMLTLGALHFKRHEIMPTLKHRYMLTVYLIVLAVLLAFDSNAQMRETQIELRGPIYMAGIFTALCFVRAGMEFRFWLARRYGKRQMHLTPLLAAASAISVLAGEAALRLALPVPGRSPLEILLLFVFYWAVTEVLGALILHLVMPPLLSELRGHPIRDLTQTDPALWTEPARPAPFAPPPRSPAPGGDLVAGGRSHPFHTLIHLHALGNYVRLHTRLGADLVPGPLAQLMAQLPPELGRQVHRSHWVATAALRGWSVDGREITLYLDRGATVPVAVTRRQEVRDWLAELGIPQGKPA